MNHLLVLSRSDFRSTFRDPVFRGMLLFPFLTIAIIRWGLPVAIAKFPLLADHLPVILMWACMQTATMFGFMYGFLFLEEKEEQIWSAIRVLPVSVSTLTASRLVLGFSVSCLINWTLIRLGAATPLPFWQEIVLAFQFSLVAPLIALILGAFARNRIEGLAQMKVFNLLLIAPGLMYVISHPVLHVLAVVPTYWSFRAMEMAFKGSALFLPFLGVGFLVYFVALWWLSRRMGRQIADS